VGGLPRSLPTAPCLTTESAILSRLISSSIWARPGRPWQ
jgi:hypothetical protein